MSSEHIAPGRTVNLGMALFLTAFAVLYVVPVLFVICDGVIPHDWWGVPSRLFLVVSPVYVRALWKHHAECVVVDYFAPYVPLVMLFGAGVFLEAGKGPINFLVVEPYVVGVLSGLYLLRFPLARAVKGRVSPVVVAIGWLVVVTAITETTALMIPDLGK